MLLEIHVGVMSLSQKQSASSQVRACNLLGSRRWLTALGISLRAECNYSQTIEETLRVTGKMRQLAQKTRGPRQ
jgi:hypothetical protein